MDSRVEQGSMLKLVIGMRVKSGFTLVEILVVLLIIGITLGFALLAFGDFGEKRRILTGAEAFAHYLKLIREEAILEGGTFGIHITPHTYQVLRFQDPGGWKTEESTRLFRVRNFPKNTSVRLKTNISSKSPEIILHASGDMTPFVLYLDASDTKNLLEITGHHDGELSVKTSNDSP
jgi:general secretion pathway protein H